MTTEQTPDLSFGADLDPEARAYLQDALEALGEAAALTRGEMVVKPKTVASVGIPALVAEQLQRAIDILTDARTFLVDDPER